MQKKNDNKNDEGNIYMWSRYLQRNPSGLKLEGIKLKVCERIPLCILKVWYSCLDKVYQDK